MGRTETDSIGYVLSNLVKLRLDMRMGWNDENSRRFQKVHLEPLEQSINQYRVTLDNYFVKLYEAKTKINRLVGSDFSPFFPSFQHERER